MITHFADTFYFLALLNTDDAAHSQVIEYAEAATAKVVTTQSVLTEVGDAFSGSWLRTKFPTLVARLEADPDTLIVAASGALFRRGVEFYQNRPDKKWSLTDCISFLVMTDMGIADALTGDHHFRQAGFNPLFAL